MYEATRCTECRAPAVVAIDPVGSGRSFGLCAAHQATFEQTTRLSYYLRPAPKVSDETMQDGPRAANA